MNLHASAILILLLAMTGGCATATRSNAAANSSPATRDMPFNDGWKFIRQDAAGAQQPVFDDASWRDVTLPHDWSVEGPAEEKWSSGTGYLPAGIGWYRKSFNSPAGWQGRRVVIRFDGVYKNSEVWCNGQSLGLRPYGYISFEYDITARLAPPGERNVIAVRVDHADFADSRWYPGSGITRDVFLSITDNIHIGTYGTYVTTPQVSATAASIDLVTTVRNDATGAPGDVSVLSTLFDAQGRQVASATSDGSVPAGGAWECRQTAKIDAPHLWAVDDAYLYDLRTQVLRGGQVIDQMHTPFGIRTFAFDPQTGFTLNAKAMKLKGVCLHEDAGSLGAVVPSSVWERRLRRLRDGGCNAIRTSHNPPAPALLDLCDRMGFLVMDEAFDEWSRGKKKWINGVNKGKFSTDGYSKDFAKWAEIDLRDMLLRDRNHPSIILWSIGNEIDFKNDPYPPNSPELPPIAAALVRVVKQFDPSRPVTAACASIPTSLYHDHLDVVGYNYQEKLYPTDHAVHPKRVIYGSENSHRIDAWQAVADNPYIAGQFLWTGIDYLGESRGWPSRGSNAGLLDLAGFEKPMFYFRKSLWTSTPMVHLDATPRGLNCYTNCETVELFQNGQSLGERPLPAERVILWSEVTAGADFKAVGKTANVAVCQFELKKPGDATKLSVRPDATTLRADGRDVTTIEVRITDAADHRVMDAVHPITCTIQGPGHLLGMESADMNSHEDARSNTRKAYRGRMVVYVQSKPAAGEMVVNLAAEGLAPVSVRIGVK